MFPNRAAMAASLFLVLLPAVTAFAADNAEDVKQRMGAGDPVAGQGKIAICKACHGEDGNGTQPGYPKLSGQYADYILKQINDFKSGLRKDPMMSAMVQSAGNDQDLLDIAAYFASQDQMKGAKRVSSKAGEARFKEGCAGCHGANGKGLAPDQSHAPVIGGQYKEYLSRQLRHFRKGARTNDPGGIMVMMAGAMTDQEIDDLAGYISGL